MKDHFRYAFLRPFGDEKLVPYSKHYLNSIAIIIFLIATLGSVASGFIAWQWLSAQFEPLALYIIFISFVILWLLGTKTVTYELPSTLRTTQKLRILFLSRKGWEFNWRFLILITFSIFTAPTLFTLALLPAIDQFNQQQFSNEKIQRLQKSESDYNQSLKLINKNIEEKRDTFDLLVNEEGGENIDDINLTIKSLERLEQEKFHLLQEFSQEDAQLKQSTLADTRQLFKLLSLPSDINNIQKALLENQTHWKYSLLKISCSIFPVLLVITLLLFKLFQPKSVSCYLNQKLETKIEIEPKSSPAHKHVNN
ncbi:MAG TPA: hypothetical protein ENJ07_04525, partial [Gammaproteobacteria bacterium]|nr:hypothetical protein [Gammaproteobacteria bacterium]